MNVKEFFTTTQAAEKLGLSYPQFMRVIKKGLIPSFQPTPRGPHLFDPYDLEVFQRKEADAGKQI